VTAAAPRAFVLRHTRLRPVPGLATMRLHLADDALTLWHASQLETDDPEAPLPYWGFAWTGGLAIGRYLGDHPEVVQGHRVLDLASGSGLCAIAAMQAGAARATAVDIDPFAIAAIEVNARANRVRVTATRADILGADPPDVDVLLAGDCWYEAGLAERVLPWLERAAAAGIHVLAGDRGRRYLPLAALEEIASYDVRTTTDLDDMEPRPGRVFTLRAARG
jgi:predicted nicotinamide N-methyase